MGEGDRNAVSVDFKTLSSSSSPSPSLETLVRSSLLCRRRRPLPPLLLVDVRPLGKAGRVPSATRVVVRQERLPQSAKGRGDIESKGSLSSISKEALSIVLFGSLVEAGAAVFPAGVASFTGEEGEGEEEDEEEGRISSSLFLLRIVEVENSKGGGASRVVRSTEVDLV